MTETSPAAAVDHGAEAALLVARIQAGERTAEEAFVKRYTRPLRAILRVRCRDDELCRDVTQDALRVVLVRIREQGLDQPAGLIGFLRGTALNLLANEMRRSEHRLTSTASDWLDQAIDERSDPYDTVESEDMARAVRRVIAGMKVERDRELLWRHYVKDDSKERLCAEFALSAEHFDRVLHRARQRLKELLVAAALGGG